MIHDPPWKFCVLFMAKIRLQIKFVLVDNDSLGLKLSDLITPYETFLPHQESSRLLGWWNLYLLYPSIKKNSAAHYLEPKSGTRRHSFNNLQLHYWLEGKREGGGSLAANHDIRIIYSLPTEVANKNNSVIPKLPKLSTKFVCWKMAGRNKGDDECSD